MGYTYPGSSTTAPRTTATMNSAIASSYATYAAQSGYSHPAAASPSHVQSGPVSLPTVHGSRAPISLSSAPTTISCAYCRKQHIPLPQHNVSHPQTKASIPTCSNECHKSLLKSMLASYHRAPTSAPSFGAGGYSQPAQPTYSSAPVTYASGTPALNTNNYAPSYNSAHQTSVLSFGAGSAPTPSYAAYPSPTLAQPHGAPGYAPVAAQSQSTSRYQAPQGKMPVVAKSTASVHQGGAKSHSQPHAHANSDHGKGKGVGKGAQTSGGNSATATKAKASGRGRQGTAKETAVPGGGSSMGGGAKGSGSTAVVTAKNLDFQLTKWSQKRQSMPHFWQVHTVILDTNVLLDDSPDVISDLRRYSGEGVDLKFVVPYVLIQELDSLKARAHGPYHAARHAITALHEKLVSKKEKWIRGQKQHERESLEGTLPTTSGDDRILECANYFHKNSPPGTKIMLLTHDKNLSLKATLCGIITGTVNQLKEFLADYRFLINERETLKRQMAGIPGQNNSAHDFRVEDYVPADDDADEEDEFEKVKKQRDAERAAAQAEAHLIAERAAKESELNALRADALSRLPAGTKTDLYDHSDSEEPSSAPSSLNSHTHPNPTPKMTKKQKRAQSTPSQHPSASPQSSSNPAPKDPQPSSSSSKNRKKRKRAQASETNSQASMNETSPEVDSEPDTKKRSPPQNNASDPKPSSSSAQPIIIDD